MFLWVILLLISAGAFLALVVWVLPRLFLKNRYSIDEPCGRGLKKYRFRDTGVAVVYEPQLGVRKYIRQYLLISRDGKKTLRCKVDEALSYLDYDVVLFDASNTVFSIISVKDLLERKGYTKEVVLPPETAYVTLLLNAADDTEFDTKRSGVRVSVLHLFFFSIASMGLSACLAFLIKLCFSHLFGGVLRESFRMSSAGNSLTLLASLLIGGVGAFVTVAYLVYKYRKK